MPCPLILSLFFLDIKILKNRKFIGSVAEQNIRTKSKPIIQEVNSKWVLYLFGGFRVVLIEANCEIDWKSNSNNTINIHY